MISAIENHVGEIYAAFAGLASLLALWAMQKVTVDANWYSFLGKVKILHRLMIGVASIALMYSAAETLYNDSDPRLSDFLLIFILFLVLVLSVMRHIQAPATTEHRTHWYDHAAL